MVNLILLPVCTERSICSETASEPAPLIKAYRISSFALTVLLFRALHNWNLT